MSVYEDTDYDVYEDEDDVTATRLAELEQENARLKAQLSTRAPAPGTFDVNAAMAAATSQEEVRQAIANYNASLPAPEEEPPEIDHDALQAEMAGAQSQEEVLAAIHAAGGYSQMNPRF